MVNLDGGSLPGPVKPMPEYRGTRRTDDPKFRETLKRAEESDEVDARLALNLLRQATGSNHLARNMADILDEWREYRIRLGERPPYPLVNAG